MLPLKLKEIAAAIGAENHENLPDIEITSICTDSRDVEKGSLFAAKGSTVTPLLRTLWKKAPHLRLCKERATIRKKKRFL